MTNKTVAFVQARCGSTRLPGKMLEQLGGYTLIEWVLRRVQQSTLLDGVMLLTSINPENDELCVIAERLGVSFFRGDEDDVLARFCAATSQYPADYYIRVCGDNPFICPKYIDDLVALTSCESFDYAYNHASKLGVNVPDGFGAEIIANAALKRVADEAVHTSHREHVTKYIWDHRQKFLFRSPKTMANKDKRYLKLDVDQQADLDNLRAIVKEGVTISSLSHEIMETIGKLPSVHRESMVDTDWMRADALLYDLYRMPRSVSANANKKTLERLAEEVPWQMLEVPGGTMVFDWVVPKSWELRSATISDATGQTIISTEHHLLHCVSHSEPIHKKMTFSELAPNLHTHATDQSLIPYRSTYYRDSWGFCVTADQMEKLKDGLEPLTVQIDASFTDQPMAMAEMVVEGRSKREILITSYICHPQMANDNLSGVILCHLLADYLSQQSDLKWTYRLALFPETVGACAYASLRKAELQKNCIGGLILSTVGGVGSFSLKESFDPEHWINRVICNALEERDIYYERYPFNIHGSDERQFSSPGFRVNCGVLGRDQFYTNPEYHTSDDNLEFVTGRQILDSFEVFTDIIRNIEKTVIPRRHQPHGEIMLSKHDLYSDIGGGFTKTGSPNLVDAVLEFLFWCDGINDLATIAHKTNLEISDVANVAKILKNKGIISFD